MYDLLANGSGALVVGGQEVADSGALTGEARDASLPSPDPAHAELHDGLAALAQWAHAVELAARKLREIADAGGQPQMRQRSTWCVLGPCERALEAAQAWARVQ